MLAKEPHRHATFTSGGSDHLGRTRANIADGEHAGPAGLNQERIAAQTSPRLSLTESAAQCWPREDKAVIVRGGVCGEPLCRRLSTDQYDHRTGLDRPSFACGRLFDCHSLETV